MSLVMAVICTDGIVMSDNDNRLIKTKSNRMIGYTGAYHFKNGDPVEDSIYNLLQITDTLEVPIGDEFTCLVSSISHNGNIFIEAGIIDGHKIILTRKQGGKIEQVSTKWYAIGDTDSFERYKDEFEREIQNITVEEAIPLLQEYNKLIADKESTINSACGIMTIR